jgi:competence protein ComEC
MTQRARNGTICIPAAAVTVVLIACLLSAGCTDGITFPDLSGLLPPQPASGDGKLKVYFLDVGQGDSAVVLFGNSTILIDAGEIGEGDAVVSDLRSLGVKKIDLLVATHPHSDHIGGMQNVFSAFPVDRVLDTGMPHTSALYEKFLDTVDKKNIPYTVAEQGQTIEIDPALRILVLSPPKSRLGDDLNENSIVLRISYGTVDFLFTGDAGREAEDALAKTGYPVDAGILKVAHHGSSGSTGKEFLARVDPSVAIISAGTDNPYGHPHKETLDALDAAGATVYRTDRDGTILVTSDGAGYSVTTTKGTHAGLTLAPPVTTATARTTTHTPKPTTSARTAATTAATGTTAEPVFTLPSFQIGNASFVSISRVQFDAPGDDRKNLNGEWVIIVNNGDESVLLAGWTLSDTTGTVFTFPPFILEPDRNVTVFTGPGDYNDTALFMGRTEPIWGNSGDEAVLKDGGGRVIDRKAG